MQYHLPVVSKSSDEPNHTAPLVSRNKKNKFEHFTHCVVNILNICFCNPQWRSPLRSWRGIYIHLGQNAIKDRTRPNFRLFFFFDDNAC